MIPTVFLLDRPPCAEHADDAPPYHALSVDAEDLGSMVVIPGIGEVVRLARFRTTENPSARLRLGEFRVVERIGNGAFVAGNPPVFLVQAIDPTLFPLASEEELGQPCHRSFLEFWTHLNALRQLGAPVEIGGPHQPGDR